MSVRCALSDRICENLTVIRFDLPNGECRLNELYVTRKYCTEIFFYSYFHIIFCLKRNIKYNIFFVYNVNIHVQNTYYK